jgi:WD40 repeat protein
MERPSDDGTARVWDLRTGACVATIDGGGEVKRVAWSPDGGAIASACGGGVARVTPSSGGTFAAAVASSASASLGGGGPGGGGHADVVFDVAWTRDGGTVITASHDATWRTWSA